MPEHPPEDHGQHGAGHYSTPPTLGPVHVNGIDLSVVVTGTTTLATGFAVLRALILDYARRS